jgi:hypothetical protein
MADVDIQGQAWNPGPWKDMHLQWFSDAEPVEEPVDDSGQPGPGPDAGQVESPFHTWEDQTFKTPDELNEYLKTGTLRQKDYTQKTMSHAEAVKKFENDRATWLRQQEEFDEKVKFYKDVDNFFKANPKAFAEVQKMVRQGASGADIQEIVKQAIDEQVGPKLNEVEEYRKREMAKAERSRHFDELKKKYPDFDEAGVSEIYDELMNSPTANLGTLLEYLYFARKGKGTDPAKIQKDTLDNLERKSKAGIPSTKGASYSTEKKATNLTMKQLAEKLKRGG